MIKITDIKNENKKLKELLRNNEKILNTKM